MIHLEKLSGNNLQAAIDLSVSEDQQNYVASNTQSIMEAYLALSHHGHAFPFVICNDDTPVGFCMIGFGVDDDWTDAPSVAGGNYNLWRLMIDRRYQGKGFGRAAMKLILDFIRSRPCGNAEYCWLSYEPQNTAAKTLYSSFGFRETEEWDHDEKIAVLTLNAPRMHIHIAALDDRNFWFSLDKHLNEALFTEKVRQKTGYILTLDDEPAGLLRYSLFWDTIPFCNLLYVKPDKQRKGCGRALMTFWEHEMKSKGCDLVMTSTQADEQAQHFYRRLGYADCGGFTLPFPEYQQPLELILAKKLS